MATDGSWIDWVVVSIVIGVGLAILYKALKEPLDLLGGGIKRLLGGVKDKLSDAGSSGTERIIQYG